MNHTVIRMLLVVIGIVGMTHAQTSVSKKALLSLRQIDCLRSAMGGFFKSTKDSSYIIATEM